MLYEYLGEEVRVVVVVCCVLCAVCCVQCAVCCGGGKGGCCTNTHTRTHPPHTPTPRPQYPEVLGSILGGLKAVVNVIGMTRMTPPIKELLPRLTPILKNRHEKARGGGGGCLLEGGCPSRAGPFPAGPCDPLAERAQRRPTGTAAASTPTRTHTHTHEKPQVQENCIDLVGRIADRGAEYVPAREWMRICFELLDMLKAHKKAIRRATVNTFGYIAKAIGPQVRGGGGGVAAAGAGAGQAGGLRCPAVGAPSDTARAPPNPPATPPINATHSHNATHATHTHTHTHTHAHAHARPRPRPPQDVLVTLLNNLKVQERQNRVCTTVAIAIVAEACQPFTVLPALMNEYRTPENNVQNGVLKVGPGCVWACGVWACLRAGAFAGQEEARPAHRRRRRRRRRRPTAHAAAPPPAPTFSPLPPPPPPGAVLHV